MKISPGKQRNQTLRVHRLQLSGRSRIFKKPIPILATSITKKLQHLSLVTFFFFKIHLLKKSLNIVTKSQQSDYCYLCDSVGCDLAAMLSVCFFSWQSKRGTVDNFQTLAEVDKMNFACKYQPIPNHSKLRKLDQGR